MLRFLIVVVLVLSQPVYAAVPPDCETIAEQTAQKYGIPRGVMAAISRVEAGYKWSDGRHRAWPWTANFAGESAYYKTHDELVEQVEAAILDGKENIDLGCMQINLRWHGDHFSTLAQMADPAKNVDYAARFLLDLYDQFGTWQQAIGAYHSRDPARSQDYAAKVLAVYNRRTHTAPVQGVQKLAQTTANQRTDRAPSAAFSDTYAPNIRPSGIPKMPKTRGVIN